MNHEIRARGAHWEAIRDSQGTPARSGPPWHPRAMGRKGKKKGKKKGKPSGCVCWDAGGFAEHLPAHEWKELMARKAGCPVHGDGSWKRK